jgi:hypothetical protein
MLLQACGSLPRVDAVPPALTERAAISGIPNSRYWLDSDLGPFIQDAIQDTKRESEALAEAGKPVDPLPPVNLLAHPFAASSMRMSFATGNWSRSGPE